MSFQHSSQFAPQPTDETIESLIPRLAAYSVLDGLPQPFEDLAKLITQNVVDNWNEFMRKNNEYRSVGNREDVDRLKLCISNLKSQYESCVKGQQKLPSDAMSWDGYFDDCGMWADAVRMESDQIMKLRAAALKSAGALRAVERGLFSQTGWVKFIDQVIGHTAVVFDIDTIRSDAVWHALMWKTQKNKYLADPKEYKFTKVRVDTSMYQAGPSLFQFKGFGMKMDGKSAEIAKAEEVKAEKERVERQSALRERFAELVREEKRLRLEDKSLAQHREGESLTKVDVPERPVHEKTQRQNKK